MFDFVSRVLILFSFLFSLWGCAPSEESHENPVPTAKKTELVVFSSGGFFAAYDVLGPQFERDTGITLITHKGSSSGGAPDSIPERLKRGEYADVVILSSNGFKNIANLGFVDSDSRIDLARSQIGMAVKEGTSVPDISSAEKFVEVLKAADSIGYSASASGTYLSTKLWPKIGLWEELKPKSKRILSERVATVVARGDVEIGFQQISEILPIPGVSYVGPIPEEYQKTTMFTSGLTIKGNQKLGQQLLDYLSDTGKADEISATGLDPVNKPAINK